MSMTLYLKGEIEALCEAVGLEMKGVKQILILPSSITFTVLAQPDIINKMGASEMETVVTYPWSISDGPSGR